MLSDLPLLQAVNTLLLVRFRQVLGSASVKMLESSKTESRENTKLPFKAENFGLGDPNNEVGQPKSMHCFHSATVYSYFSLQYLLSSLALTTPVSPAAPPLLSSLPVFHPPHPLPPRDMQRPSATQKRIKS